jgi:hypothetical protein
MNDVVTLRVQSFGERRVFAYCNHESKDLCTVRHNYVTGREPPNYPVPAIPQYLDLIAATPLTPAADFSAIGRYLHLPYRCTRPY